LTHLAESLGYTNVWYGDSQNIWRETYVTMAAAAVGTTRVVLGTAVTNATTRHESVLASSWATLAELTNGRVVMGIGAGDSSLRTMGMTPMKLADLERAVIRLRALLAGDWVTGPVSGIPYRLDYLAEASPVPVYLAASSPQSLRLAGRVADGVILAVGVDPRSIRSALVDLEEGANEVGRSLENLDIVLWIPAAIADDGRIARDLARPHVASMVVQPRPAEMREEHSEAIASIRARYNYFRHMNVEPEVASLVPDALVDMFALVGTADECREKLQALVELPIDQISIVPQVAPGTNRAEAMRLFAELFTEIR
jgi:5,10-methylenetetrahydromethanopterin reductase